MRKIFLILFVLPLILLTACNKSSSSYTCNYTAPTTVASATEIASLKAYLDSNSITYTVHPSGIFYNITAPGTGTITPGVCSYVTVKYMGRLITTTTPFDQNTDGTTFQLGQLIKGWQYGIPLIKPGGSITLYIPPSLGYGATGAGQAIPPNSYLVFTINLLGIQ
jgi:FKBP-type peptidyl-prolyl cis-trans isomerase